MRSMWTDALPLVAAILLCCSARADEPVDYLRQVKPLLARHCTACHGALKQQAGLRLDTAAAARRGGDSGPAIAAGDAEHSLLVARITAADARERMPPAGQRPLAPDEISLLTAWVAQGTAAPDDEQPDEDPRLHWAFRRIERPLVPPLPSQTDSPPQTASPPHNAIDAFIAAGYRSHGVVPGPPAAKAVLFRRLYLDLVGRPPTREELRAFLADDSGDAYERLIERLLASPQYGERWGRHWMDVWRYSDWYGRRAVPDWWNSGSQIWRWRDWIVRSLNADKGYDRMLQEMLAGDELAPDDGEAAVATGYLVRNWYALNYNQWMKDIVEHTGKAFLGLTLNCCHCHDHKYDPISQEEYFRFRAFFEPLELRQDRVPGEPDPGPFQKYKYAELRKVVRTGSVRVFDERPDAPTHMYLQGDERNVVADRTIAPAAPAFLGGADLIIQPVSLPTAAWYPGLKPFVREEELAARRQALAAAQTAVAAARDKLEKVLADAAVAAAQADLDSLVARIAADEARYADPPDAAASSLALAAEQAERQTAVAAAEASWLQAEAQVSAARAAALSGDEKAKQQLAALEPLTAAALASLQAARTACAAPPAGAYQPLSPQYPPFSTGRRAALARWIASRDNPLTARVAVNHIWMRHFGRPLVESPFDFGRNGKRPSHPELIDWLAAELIESGWSMKHLHRLIVTSGVYRLDSSVRGETQSNVPLDADNRWLWRYNSRRVEAEVVRDSILHAAGELEAMLGGPELDNGLEYVSRRRSLYFAVFPEDGGNMKFLELFDAPDPCDCYRRSESLVPQQALAMTNSRLSLNAGRLLACALWAQAAAESAADSLPARFVTAAFEQVLSRQPTPDELAACLDYLGKQQKLLQAANSTSVSAATAEDLTPPSTDPLLRACESLVQALFSHHDFVTLR